MVQRRSSSNTNPFDSDDEKPVSPRYAKPSAPPLPAYSNPFDDDEPELQKPNFAAKNPFDDDQDEDSQTGHRSGLGRRRSDPFEPAKRRTAHPVEPVRQRSDPVDLEPAEPVKQQRPRRRDVMKEKISSISEDVASKASRVTQSSLEYMAKPRSKNLMQESSRDRKLLLEDEDGPKVALPTKSEQSRATNERIGRALKDGTSLDGESVQELQDFGIQQAEETTSTVYNALRLAGEIKESATSTSIQLHQQGEQIRRTHERAVDIDHELGRGEKLLGSLGGLFSKTWKPKKGRDIAGPVITRSDSFKRKAHALEQRRALGIGKNTAAKVAVSSSAEKSSQFQARIQTEFAKQDDALSDLSAILGELKGMSIDMGDEIQKQTHDLGRVEDDVTELGYRVKGANDRARKLLGR